MTENIQDTKGLTVTSKPLTLHLNPNPIEGSGGRREGDS